MAAHRPELACLHLGLNTFGYNPNIEASGDIDQTLDDHHARILRPQASDEGLINLDDIDGNTQQMRQRGVSRPKIIERDEDASRAQGFNLLRDDAIAPMRRISRLGGEK